MSGTEIVEKELSYRIMQAAFEVYNHLGPGFPEAIYERAMADHELPALGLSIEKQKRIPVYFKGKSLGFFLLDLVVNNRVILELKAVAGIAKVHEQQALSYLKATGLPLAIVINFGAARVQSSRIVNTKGRTGQTSIPPLPRNHPTNI
jgi:GxxExxY protein